MSTNAPESEALTLADAEIFEAARVAVSSLKKTFELWIVIGAAVVRARKIADERGGRKTFERLLEQQGLSRVLGDKATWTRLLAIMKERAAVEAWRATLTEKQQIDWAAPSTIFKRCPVFQKPEPAKEIEKKPGLREVNASLQEENHALKGKLKDAVDLNQDKADDIARTIVSSISATRAEAIARAILKELKVKKAPAAPAKRVKSRVNLPATSELPAMAGPREAHE